MSCHLTMNGDIRTRRSQTSMVHISPQTAPQSFSASPSRPFSSHENKRIDLRAQSQATAVKRIQFPEDQHNDLRRQILDIESRLRGVGRLPVSSASALFPFSLSIDSISLLSSMWEM